MNDPFAFMGRRRGSNRPDEQPPPLKPELRFDVREGREVTDACFDLLNELNAWVAAPTADVVANIASRHGFECDTPWPGVFTLSYGHREVAAFLVQGPPSALHEPVFQLFIGVDGLALA